jgi:hypothetical protein
MKRVLWLSMVLMGCGAPGASTVGEDAIVAGGGTSGGGLSSGVGIVNGDFEMGSLYGWSHSGVARASLYNPIGYGWTAVLGGSSPWGYNSISQTFTVPSGASQLSFVYFSDCAGNAVTTDWTTAFLTDESTGVTTTVVPPVCWNGGWTNYVTAPVVPWHRYTIDLVTHASGWAPFPTTSYWDYFELR